MYSRPLTMLSFLRLLLGTAVFSIIFSSRAVQCFTEEEILALAIGRPKAHPYIIDEYITNCLDQEIFYRHDKTKTSWSDISILECVINMYKEDPLRMYRGNPKEDLLDSYCDKWIPDMDQCFESTTSLINVCREKQGEYSVGFDSLFFSAAYMNFLCTDRNFTLENIELDTLTGISLNCFSDLENDIRACVKSARFQIVKKGSLEICPQFKIVRDCFEGHYKEPSLSTSCNSTNNNETSAFVTTLMQRIQSTLCAGVDTMEKKRTELKASRHTANDSPKSNNKNKSRNSGIYLTFDLMNMAVTLSVALIPCMMNLKAILLN